jgi:hypothetical protein
LSGQKRKSPVEGPAGLEFAVSYLLQRAQLSKALVPAFFVARLQVE